jgi:hypothetical protein
VNAARCQAELGGKCVPKPELGNEEEEEDEDEERAEPEEHCVPGRSPGTRNADEETDAARDFRAGWA